jgi:hypothetical protein
LLNHRAASRCSTATATEAGTPSGSDFSPSGLPANTGREKEVANTKGQRTAMINKKQLIGTKYFKQVVIT